MLRIYCWCSIFLCHKPIRINWYAQKVKIKIKEQKRRGGATIKDMLVWEKVCQTTITISYIFCKDWNWIGPKTGLGSNPSSPNNKFVKRG